MRRTIKLIPFLVSAILVVLFFGFEIKSEETKNKKPERSSAQTLRSPSQACIVSEEALRDISSKQRDLEEREKKLAEKQSKIEAKEKAIQEQLKQLEDLKKEIAQVKVESDAKKEEKMNKLVETLEQMSPKKASELIANLGNELAVESMMRLSSEKLAKVLNLMDVERSKVLSELLALGRTLNQKKNQGGSDGSARRPAQDS